MRSNSGKKTNSPSKDKVKKSMHNLQPSTTDKENLIGLGRTLRSSPNSQEAKQPKEVKSKIDVSEKTKNDFPKCKTKVFEDKTTVQTEEDKVKVTVEDLTNPAGPSETDWEVLAGSRLAALKDALNENEMLTLHVKQLEAENLLYEKMVNEARAIVEVLQEMIENDSNGINNSLEDNTL